MVPTKEELDKVKEKISSLDERKAIATGIADLFALGCWLHLKGHKEAGTKAVNTALQAINLDHTNKTLYLKIIDNISGNELLFSSAIWAHAEINELFKET